MNPGLLLLIEDNSSDELLLRMALNQVPGWTYRSVDTLAEAIAVSREDPAPQLAFCDLGLPDSHGLDTLRSLREAAPQLPVIVVTGTEDEAVGQAAIALGAQDYLVKGDYSPRALGRCMRHALSRHKLLDELSTAKQRLHNVLLDVPMVVYSLLQQSGELRLDYCSDSTSRILGFERERIGDDARRFAQALGSEQAADLFLALGQAQEENGDHVVAEHPYRHPNGQKLWLQHRIAVHRQGNDRRIIGTIIDRSDERAMEQMREQEAAREAADAAKDRFLSLVSHELRNPLQAIIGNADHLAMDTHLQECNHCTQQVDNIIKASGRMAGLIDSLLQHSRTGASFDPKRLVPVRLASLVDEVVAEMLPRCQERDIHCNWLCQPSDRQVFGDAQALRHVLVNVFDNSIKYGRDGMSIDLSLNLTDEATLSLSICDQGCGIDPQHLDAVCQPFYQEDGTRAGGVGLGMSLVADLVAKMNGSLSIASPGVDQGCRVSITFPLAGES